MSNHALNARLHAYPQCPECNSPDSAPCRTPTGFVCAPHASRLKMADGDIIVIRADDARAAGKLRAVRELVTTIYGVSEMRERAHRDAVGTTRRRR